NIRQVVSDFRRSAADFRTQYDRRQASSSDVQTLLDRAGRLNWMISRRQALAPAQTDWRYLRDDLDALARVYRLNWDWNTQRGYDADRGGASARLSGTFQLNPSRSDDAASIVDRAVRTIPYNDRQRVSQALLRRLDSPERLAIDRQGRMITLASSRAPQ